MVGLAGEYILGHSMLAEIVDYEALRLLFMVRPFAAFPGFPIPFLMRVGAPF